MKIIINGRALAGKDTIADYLVDKYGFKKISFADPIYYIAREFFGMENKDRWLLQSIGQKMREIDQDVWVRYALKEAAKYNDVVIPDCRQANEYIHAVKNGFIPIRVKASLENRIQRAIKRDGAYPDVSLWEAPSETGADNFEYVFEIDNDGTLDELYKKIDDFLASVGYRQ